MTHSPDESGARRELARAAKRVARRPHLAAAVAGVQTGAYFFYRTRYLLPRVGLRTLLHVVELYLLSSLVPWSSMGPYFLLRGLTLVVNGAHFSWLEGLRQRVRELARQGRFGAARTSTARWIAVSVAWGGVALASAIAWMAFDVDGYPGFSVFDAFAFACALRVLMEGSARAYHSMVYALRRVRRPLSSFLLPDAVEPVGLLVLFPVWGLWSFSMVAVLGAVVRAYLSYAWTKKSLEGTRLDGPLRLRNASPHLDKEPFLAGVVPGLAGISSQIDAVLLVALASATDFAALPIIYLARPVLAGVQGAVRTFYFDFKKLEHRCPAILQRTFLRRVARLTVSLGMVAGLLMGATTLWFGQGEISLAVALAAFGASRSLFSLTQVLAFSLRRYVALLGVSGVGAVVFAASGGLGMSLAAWFGGAALCFTLMALALLWRTRFVQTTRSVYPLVDLLLATRTAHDSVALVSAVLQPRVRVSLGRVMMQLRTSFPRDLFFREGRTRVYGLMKADERVARSIVQEIGLASAGALSSIRCEIFPSGTELLTRLRVSDDKLPLHTEHLELLREARNVDTNSLDEFMGELQREVPGIRAFRLDGSARGQPQVVGDENELRAVVAVSGLLRRERSRGARARLFPGDMKGAYLLHWKTDDASPDPESWRRRLRTFAIALALAPTLPGQKPHSQRS